MFNAFHFYYLSHKLYKLGIPIIPQIVKLIIFLFYNSSIPYHAIIGKGSRFAYGGIGVVIHKRVVIGKNCNIGSNTTIGGKSGHFNVPIIGDNVYISTGAKILGPIEIGNNVIIGANSVVIENVASNMVVAGVPAKVIKALK